MTENKLLKQYHADKLSSEVIEINWDIFNICNYKCSYCYMINDKSHEWLKISKWDKQLRIIDIISDSLKPVHISLVGGEPTLFHKFNILIDLIIDSFEKNKLSNELIITTNNSDCKKLLNIDNIISKKIKLILSYHSEEANDMVFISNLEKLIEHGFKEITVNIMMNHNKKYWNKLINISKKISSYNIKVEVSYLTLSKKFFKYNKEFQDVINQISLYTTNDRKYIFEYNNHTEYYSEIDLKKVIEDNKTNFFNYKCYINRININIDCIASLTCIEKIVDLKDILINNNLPEISCPYMQCNYNCHLSFLKEIQT